MKRMSLASSHRSRCRVWANLVSPRIRIERKPARRVKAIALSRKTIRLLLRGAIAATIEQIQRFGRVGQRDDQRVVTELAVVGEVHASFALGIAGHDAAVGLDDRLGEELGRLLGPDPQPRLIDRVHQVEDIGWGEAAAEVPLGGRVGDAFGTQGVEIDLVIAPQFEVLEAQAADEDIEGDVQDVVGFMVGQMPLEEVELAIDLLDEIDLLSQEEEGTDAAGPEPAGALGVVIMDIGGGHHRYRPLGTGCIGEAFLDSPPPVLEDSLLACGPLFSESSAHSKAPWSWNGEDVLLPPLFQESAGFSSFFLRIGAGEPQNTLG